MKNIALILLLLTIVTWFTIAIYWTGNTDSKIESPESNQPIIIPKDPKPTASSSATPSPSIQTVTATVSTGLRY